MVIFFFCCPQALRNEDIQSYLIQYRAGYNPIQEVQVPNTQTSVVLRNLTPYTTYAILVKAKNCGQEGPEAFTRERTMEGGEIIVQYLTRLTNDQKQLNAQCKVDNMMVINIPTVARRCW